MTTPVALDVAVANERERLASRLAEGELNERSVGLYERHTPQGGLYLTSALWVRRHQLGAFVTPPPAPKLLIGNVVRSTMFQPVPHSTR